MQTKTRSRCAAVATTVALLLSGCSGNPDGGEMAGQVKRVEGSEKAPQPPAQAIGSEQPSAGSDRNEATGAATNDQTARPGPLRQLAPSTAALLEAAFKGDMRTVQAALAGGVSADTVNDEGTTVLMMAAFNGHTEVVGTLLDHGATVGTEDGVGRTALLYASSGPYAETVALLLENGADVNLTDDGERWTALMFAGGEGLAGVIQTLLEHGADASLTDDDGETALTFAERNGHREAAALLRAAMQP